MNTITINGAELTERETLILKRALRRQKNWSLGEAKREGAKTRRNEQREHDLIYEAQICDFLGKRIE